MSNGLETRIFQHVCIKMSVCARLNRTNIGFRSDIHADNNKANNIKCLVETQTKQDTSMGPFFSCSMRVLRGSNYFIRTRDLIEINNRSCYVRVLHGSFIYPAIHK